MLVAEDLLLLLTDDRTGKSFVDSARLDIALGGAALLELVLAGHAGITGPGGVRADGVRDGRVVALRQPSAGDPVLDEALRRVAARQPRKPQSVVGVLGKGLRPELFRRLAARGIVQVRDDKALGLFSTRSWPAVDSRHEAAVRAGLHEVLVAGRPPTAREGSLIALLAAVDKVSAALGPAALPPGELKARAQHITRGDFAGAAVRTAIAAVNAGTTAAMSTIMIAGAAGSS